MKKRKVRCDAPRIICSFASKMEYEKLAYQLRLITLLAQGRFLTVSEMADRTGLHPRTVYRNLVRFPDVGLPLEKRGRRYRLSPEAPFLEAVSARLHFSPDEVVTLAQILTSVKTRSAQVTRLREKLARIHDGGVLIPHDVDETAGANIRAVFEAIRKQRVVLLRGYASPHSRRKRDRIVEPYSFLPGNREVRCYEVSSEMNKTFNLSRADEVVLLDLRWDHADRHKPLYVDLFHFSGEERTRIRLRLGLLAKSVLLEEYPQADAFLSPTDSEHWLLDAEFCSMKGVGRFVLGLMEDIEVVDSPDFEHYLRTTMQARLQRPLSVEVH